jgi:carboxypeptidase family protein
MHRFVPLIVAVALMCAPSAPLAAGQGGGSLEGIVLNSDNQAIANAAVQLRNLANADLVGSTVTDATGRFRFIGISPGSYAIVVLNAESLTIGASGAIAVAANTALSGITVTIPSRRTGAGAIGGRAAASGFSTAAIVTAAASAAGVVAVVAVKSQASPSR